MNLEEAIINVNFLLGDIRSFNNTAKAIEKFIKTTNETIKNLDINWLNYEEKDDVLYELSKWENFFNLLHKECNDYISLSPYYHFRNGVLLHQSGHYEVAIDHFNLAIEFEPFYADALYYKGLALFHLNRKEEALLLWNKLINDELLDFSIIYYSLAQALDDLNRREESIEIWNKFIQRRPDSGFGYLYKSINLQRLNRNKESIECLNQSIKHNPKFFRAYAFKEESLQKWGRKQEAIDCLNEFIQVDPYYFESYNMIGSILFQEKRFEESLKYFNEAIKKKSNSGAAYKNKGDTLYELGKIEEALDCYNEVLSINPNDQVVKRKIEIIKADQKKWFWF